MLRSIQQNKQLHGLLAKAGIDRSTDEGQEMVEDMVLSATNQRSKHTKDLTTEECQQLINGLKRQLGEKAERAAFSNGSKANVMRRKILSRCREMGAPWYENGAYNWPHINAWLFKSGYLKKGLNDYTEKELPKLVFQFNRLLESHYAHK